MSYLIFQFFWYEWRVLIIAEKEAPDLSYQKRFQHQLFLWTSSTWKMDIREIQL